MTKETRAIKKKFIKKGALSKAELTSNELFLLLNDFASVYGFVEELGVYASIDKHKVREAIRATLNTNYDVSLVEASNSIWIG